jgi:general secretion pathway protein A
VQPPASPQALADPIYEAFYGLNDQPFAITTDPKFFYLSLSHQRAFSELLNGLRRREGMLLLTGETGTGKTTMCRAVLESLGSRTFSAMILNPYMSGAEVFRIVLRDFGLVSNEDLRRGALASADVAQLMDTLEGFLKSLVPLNSHAVIVLDEAQSLAPQVLDQIRLLTALELENRRLVQVILCGQQGLLTTLKSESMYALNERITRRVTLGALTPEDVEPYITHRLAVAGGGAAVSFDTGAARLIGDLSHGLPRRINVLCDRALQEGRIEGASVITADLVKRAARSLAGAPEPRQPAASQPAAAPHATAAEPAPAREAAPVTLPEVTFGHAEEAAGASGLRKRLLVVIGGLATALVLGYAYYAHQVVTAGARIPPAPARPALKVGTPLQALPVPPPDEARQTFGTPPVATPAELPAAPAPAPVPAAGGAPASSQVPGNPN